VCIYIRGSSLTVNDWDASANRSGYGCTYAAYWQNGVVIATTEYLCGDGTAWAYLSPNRQFPNGAKLCNTFLSFAGKPCETISK
jgi:hypothetical protein